MPELPEVETVKRVLKPHIVGRRIEAVTVVNEKIIAYPQPDEFIHNTVGQTVAYLSRRGKFLTLGLDNGSHIVLHLRMTGCLTLMPKDTPCEKHTHLIFALDDGRELRYEDTRRFGKFWLIANGEEDTVSGVHKLGIEPFDEKLTADYLKSKLGKSRKPIKEMLLDQGIVTGIGNIYSDEILFTAKIRPDKPCSTLTDDEFKALAKLIPERLQYFIEKNSITFDEYNSGKGRDYRNTPYLQVYGQGGKPCPVCESVLQSKTVGGRHSVYCEKCQK